MLALGLKQNRKEALGQKGRPHYATGASLRSIIYFPRTKYGVRFSEYVSMKRYSMYPMNSDIHIPLYSKWSMLEMFALFEFEVIGLAPSIHNRLTLSGLARLSVSSDWRKCGCRSHDSQSQAARQSISGIVGILHANCLIHSTKHQTCCS